MTTYTISKDQLKALIEGCESGDVLKYVPALSLLRHLQPNTQEPVGWMDDFGNTYPLAANKGAGSWLDAHKRNWKPLYTNPAPQQVAVPVPMTDDQIEEMALQEELLLICDDFYALREITRAVEAHHHIGVKP